MPARLAVLALLLLAPCLAADDKAKPALKVELDTSDAPEAAAWAKKAKALLETWHPKMVALLETEGFKPSDRVKVVFSKAKKKGGWIAYASGTTITISAAYIEKNPRDLGMVIHEHAHVLQQYPAGSPGWLTEGIADYVRYMHYEPQRRVPVDTKRAKYTDGYGTSAKFLAWVERTHDRAIIRKLNEVLRKGSYKDEFFKTHTKKSLDALWADFLVAEERNQRQPNWR